jgi:hypothetical protein
MRLIALAICAAVFLLPGVGSAQAQAPSGNLVVAGTLTCTADPSAEGRADARLSCHFKANSGRDGTFTGSIARIGPADVPEGKRVLVWTVLAHNGDHASALDGIYRGESGGSPPGVLVGGGSGDIRLEPVSAASQVGIRPVPTVLELRLEATKV